jgi:putative membrane protein
MIVSHFNTNRITFAQNNFFKLIVTVFSLLWFYFFITTRSPINWWIENILVIAFIPMFAWLQKRYLFSNISLFCIFLFLVIHCYGAQMSYTYNQLGVYAQQQFHLTRNPYDRFVHFSFGMLIAYPLFEYLICKLKTPSKYAYCLSILLITALATLFELIEWLVAATTDSETGETYVATQGDVWDAHKDIALAILASMSVMSVVYRYRNKKSLFAHLFS